MASSRPLRGRRVASPQAPPAQARVPIKKEVAVERTDGNALDGWTEPVPRTPVPSFEDHKGLERHGVLEHMAPLGQLPGVKLKTKIKYQEPTSRRGPQGKNGEAVVAQEEEAILEQPAAPTASTRRLDPQRLSASHKSRTALEKDEDADYEPKITRSTPAKPVPIQPATNGTSSPHLAIGSQKLKDVVEKAAKRSNEIGNPVLGLAITKLYEDSLKDDKVAELLAATLRQKQTEQQLIEFQDYIKRAKKQIKKDAGTPNHTPSKSVPQSPKLSRNSASRQTGTFSNAPGLKILHSTTTISNNISPSKHHTNNMAMNGVSERPAKRAKRTGSPSSDSSLSSLGSPVEDFAPAQAEPTLPTDHLLPQRASAIPSTGLRSNLFSAYKHLDGDIASPDATDAHKDSLVSKRHKLLHGERSFSDYLVAESYVRPVMQESHPVQMTPPRVASPNAKPPQSRLRNGTLQRNKRYHDDDDDDALSSPPSSPGDLLVPPPMGALRGGTPTALGRPPKATRKTARIKMS